MPAQSGVAARRRLALRGCAIGVALAGAMPVMAQAAPAPSDAAPPQPQGEAPPRQFLIAAYDVSGVTKLDPATIERAIYPFTGEARSVGDVEGARKAIEAAYKANGLETVLVDIPPQEPAAFNAGIVVIKVTEAPLGRVRVVGAKYVAPSVVLAQVPALTQGAVPDLQAAQTQIAAANRLPDREISPVLKAGAVPGTVDVDLKVKDTRPVHVSVTIDNDYNSGTSPLRVGLNASYTNMFQLGHTLRAGYLVAPEHPSESQVISGSYTAPILGSAWTLLAYGYKSNSNVAALGGTNVLGNGYQIGGRAIVRLPGTRLLQTVNFGLDYKDFKENIVIPNADPTLPAGVIETPIAYVPLTVAYSVQRATDTTVINGSVTLTAGVRGLGASEASNAVKRYNSVGNFVRINLTGDLTYAFKHDIVGYLSYSGQYADTPLVANEQFAIGGATSVRGYFLSEAVGDNGSNLIAELRSPQLAPDSWRFVQDWRAYVFVDSGFVHVRSPLPDQIVNYRLVGTGVGTRFQLFTDISGNFAVGVALTDGPTTKAGDGRAIFSVTGAF